jgi:molybdopterin converting factor small subunit
MRLYRRCLQRLARAESAGGIPASSKGMTKINIPTPLRQYAGKQPMVQVKAGSIAEALSGLVSKHPDLRRHLYTDEGKLRSFVNVYLNDEDVRYLQKEATAVTDGDTISIVPSIAGGR